MHAVAAGAVCSDNGAALGSEAVIAVDVGGDAIARDAEFAGESHALVAAGAGIARDILFGRRANWGPLCDLMEWMPWQSVQTGDWLLPRAMAWP